MCRTDVLSFSHRLKVLQSCRDFKKLFKETRERSIKALGFVKRLRTDLGVAATFHVTVPYDELLEKLKSSGYIQVRKLLNPIDFSYNDIKCGFEMLHKI